MQQRHSTNGPANTNHHPITCECPACAEWWDAYFADDPDMDEENHGTECCCETCLQNHPERDALYNDNAYYGDPDDLTPDERAWEIAQNVASIEAVPAAVWARIPAGQAISRDWALFWARKGYDCYAYKGFGEHGVWNVWLAGERIELGRAE